MESSNKPGNTQQQVKVSLCNICAEVLSPRFPVVHEARSNEVFSLSVCPNCDLGHTVPVPSDLGRYYGSCYHGGRHGITTAFCSRRRLRLVTGRKGHGAGRKLLDIGCGDGTFLLDARAAGWNVAGTELNPTIARAAGLEVRPNLVDVLELGPFDCVTLWHSLEHMPDPKTTVTSARQMLKEDGLLMIAVPDARGLQARLFGARWFHLDVPRHLYHFGPASLTILLERCGFKVVKSWHQEFEYDLLGWSQSALNCLLPTSNLFFDSLTRRATSAGALQKGASWVGGVVLSGLALPLVALGTLAGQGGTLVVAAHPG